MKVKTCKCPSCDKKLNAATRADGRRGKPAAGDVTVCTGCACLLRYSRSLRVRLLTAEDVSKLPKDLLTTLRKAQRAIQQASVTRMLKEQ